MKNTTLNLATVSVSVAFIAVAAQLTLPLPFGVPLTLQTTAIAFCAYLLGACRGATATAVYIALGAVGAPVFSGFSGGFQQLFSFTGGFIWGFIPLALLCGLSRKYRFKPHGKLIAAGAGLIGILLCYICGISQLSVLSFLDARTAIVSFALLYFPKDILSVILALFLSNAVKKRFPNRI